MKYVILRNKEGAEVPVFGVAPLSHRELAAAHEDRGAPISAGFCAFNPARGITTAGDSESLKLKPRPEDAQLIQVYYSNTLDQVAKLYP